MKRIAILVTIMTAYGLLLAACASRQQIEIYSSTQNNDWQKLNVEKILADNPPDPGWSVQVINLDRMQSMSTHLVSVRTREKLHYHDRHASTVVMISGQGTLHIGKDRVLMRPGMVVTVSRRMIHEYINESTEPSVFYVTFAPPFDGQDRVMVRKVEDLLK